MTLSTIVALLMGLLALASLWAAIRVPRRGPAGRQAATGYWIFALGAALQAWNSYSVEYSVTVAVVGTLALIAGFVQINRAWGRRATVP